MAVVLLAAAGALSAAAAAGARQSLEIGIKAYRERAVEASVEALSGALEEGLASRESAQALYYRGLAYRALGKPGQAIADLTGAIAVKNGLAPAQLADAEDNCTAARAEAGIDATESVVAARPEKRPRASSARASQSFLTTTSIDAAEPAPSPWERATIAPVPVPAAAPPERRPPASSAREPRPQSFLTTTSIDAAEPAPSPWKKATIVPPPAPAGVPTAFATQVLPGGAPPPATAAGIRLQVARVQTQSEAYALAVRLVSQHGTEFSPDMLKIERAVAENKAPVFLVRLGPFANADQAQKRCSALRRGGFDCVVLY